MASDDHNRFAEVSLGMSGRMRQRHEHLIPTALAGDPRGMPPTVLTQSKGSSIFFRHRWDRALPG